MISAKTVLFGEKGGFELISQKRRFSRKSLICGIKTIYETPFPKFIIISVVIPDEYNERTIWNFKYMVGVLNVFQTS